MKNYTGDSAGMEKQEKDELQVQQIVDTGSIITGDNEHSIHCLTIIGQIEGHNVLPSQNKTTKYEHVIPQLVSIEEDEKIDGLLMILNSAPPVAMRRQVDAPPRPCPMMLAT